MENERFSKHADHQGNWADRMNESSPGRFVPNYLLWFFVACWVVLMVLAVHGEAAGKGYPLFVLVFGVLLTASAMAAGAGWMTLLLVLIVNWCSKKRRNHFRSILRECTLFFVLVTLLAVLLVSAGD